MACVNSEGCEKVIQATREALTKLNSRSATPPHLANSAKHGKHHIITDLNQGSSNGNNSAIETVDTIKSTQKPNQICPCVCRQPNCNIENCHFYSLFSLKELINNNLNKRCGMLRDMISISVINQIIFNKYTHIVATYHDYLIYDDTTEYFSDFTHITHNKLKDKIISCAPTSIKEFPSYVALDEKLIMLRNIFERQFAINNESSILLIDKYSELFEDKKIINSSFMHQLDNDQLNFSNSNLQPSSLFSSYCSVTEEMLISKKQLLSTLLSDSISFDNAKRGNFLRYKLDNPKILDKTRLIERTKRNIAKIKISTHFSKRNGKFFRNYVKQIINVKINILETQYYIRYHSYNEIIKALFPQKVNLKSNGLNKNNTKSSSSESRHAISQRSFLSDLHNVKLISSMQIRQ
jgi:hypothetical protein